MVRYGKYNTVFPYRTFSKNSVRNSVSYFLPKSNRTVVTPWRRHIVFVLLVRGFELIYSTFQDARHGQLSMQDFVKLFEAIFPQSDASSLQITCSGRLTSTKTVYDVIGYSVPKKLTV